MSNISLTARDSSSANQSIVILTPDQIQNLNASPVTLIPAPGAGRVIQIISATLIYDFATTPYSNINSSLTVCYTDTNNIIISLASQIMMAASVDQISYGQDIEFDGGNPDASALVNIPVIVLNPGAGEFADGDSPMTIILKYFIFDSGL